MNDLGSLGMIGTNITNINVDLVNNSELNNNNINWETIINETFTNYPNNNNNLIDEIYNRISVNDNMSVNDLSNNNNSTSSSNLTTETIAFLLNTLTVGYTNIMNILNTNLTTSYSNEDYNSQFSEQLFNSNNNSALILYGSANNLFNDNNNHNNNNIINNYNNYENNNDIDYGGLYNSSMANLNQYFINNITGERILINANSSTDLMVLDEDELNGGKRDFVFDRGDVKVIFVTLYSLVFCCCFLGNLLVILVVTLSRRLRSITNFFLANLAVADFCVGVFCVMQNLTIYLIDSWVFGEFLCRMYQFVHSLSYTASIFILVVICMERYFAIIHPITCKQILTPTRLRLVILGVWITSAVYSTPKFIFSKTITNIHTNNGAREDICVLDRQMFNSELLDFINFGFLYVTPLLVMTILYSRIAIALWKSSRGLERHIALQTTSTASTSTAAQQPQQQLTVAGTGTTAAAGAAAAASTSPSNSGIHLFRKQSSRYGNRSNNVGINESQVSMEANRVVVTTWKKATFHQRHGTQVAQMSNSTNNVLRARRGVIRMLIIVVLTFALCNLPYHGRKMWMYWSDSYKGYSNFNALFTPLTFLATYFNSGVNPLLYAFLSRNFRKGMRELLLCSFKKSKGKSPSLNQRTPLQAVNIPLEALKETDQNLNRQASVSKEQHTEIVNTEGM